MAEHQDRESSNRDDQDRENQDRDQQDPDQQNPEPGRQRPAELSGRVDDEEMPRPSGWAGRSHEAAVYDWYQRGLELLASGSADAAALLFERAVAAEPTTSSLREAWARALSDARRFAEAAEQFQVLVEREPHDDYARFGLGYTRFRLGDIEGAAQHLAMAVTMRPDRQDYARALDQARATLRAREERDR